MDAVAPAESASGLEHHFSEVPALVDVPMRFHGSVPGERKRPVHHGAQVTSHDLG
jgi:hypothetical protein